ncbi:MAG TPA: hypothetical protein VFM56_07265 [Solimonas sp.]|nr:hypothetical protein [Solimonas sp.]
MNLNITLDGTESPDVLRALGACFMSMAGDQPAAAPSLVAPPSPAAVVQASAAIGSGAPAEAPKSRGRKKAEPAAQPAQPVAAQPAAPAQTAPAQPAAQPVQSSAPAATATVEEMRDALNALINATDMQTAIALLGGHGFAKISDIPADKYGEICASAKAKLAQAQAGAA